MIRLTRLNREEFILNAELIRYVERCPDTLITLISGETLMVAESLEDVVRRTLSYHQAKNLIPRAEHLPCDGIGNDNKGTGIRKQGTDSVNDFI